MPEFIKNNIVAIVFGISTFVFSYLTIIYKRREQKAKLAGLVEENDALAVFLTREALLDSITEQYSSARKGDVIWGQCVGCHRYFKDLSARVLEKAAQGVTFKILLNAKAPNVDGLKSLFMSLRYAEIREAKENKIRIHGLSNKEVIIGLSTLTGTVAFRVRDPEFVSIIKDYFEKRWDNCDDLTTGKVSPTTEQRSADQSLSA